MWQVHLIHVIMVRYSLICVLREYMCQQEVIASAIVTMDEVQEYLYNRPIDGKVLIDKKIKKSLDNYYAEYGVKK